MESSVEKRLQDKRGGHLVDYAAMRLSGVAGLIEDLVSFVRCEALIPQVNGELCQFTEFSGEGLDLCCLRGDLSVWAERVSHHDSGNFKAAAEPGKRAEVLAGVTAALEG